MPVKWLFLTKEHLLINFFQNTSKAIEWVLALKNVFSTCLKSGQLPLTAAKFTFLTDLSKGFDYILHELFYEVES